MAYQYAVKALAGGKLARDESLLMYLPNDGGESEDLMNDLRSGEGYGVDYVIVVREVSDWTTVAEG